MAPGSDVRTDAPRYRVWRDGELAEEVEDVRHLWIAPPQAPTAAAASPPPHAPDARSDWVAFLLGCSFSFEAALLRAGLPVRHLQEERGQAVTAAAAAAPPPPASHAAACPKNVPMYVTSLACEGAGPFQGPLVVSMRPMTPQQVRRRGCGASVAVMTFCASLLPLARRPLRLTA